MIGGEQVKDRDTKEPAAELTAAVADEISDGIVSKSGAHAMCCGCAAAVPVGGRRGRGGRTPRRRAMPLT